MYLQYRNAILNVFRIEKCTFCIQIYQTREFKYFHSNPMYLSKMQLCLKMFQLQQTSLTNGRARTETLAFTSSCGE